ncbi:MAG TPA: FecR domain-containing protein [Vicinamibacteria bacterium]|nr:FecR domain-containing protein [Vicinamibacteria bacterium]
MATDRKPRRAEDDLVDWFTVTYRSIFLTLGGILLAAGLVYAYFFREPPPARAVDPAPPAITTARFTTLEGSVKVKPVGQFQWMPADRAMFLKKSDLVRTGPGSAAEITFFDGTVVHVRPDSLITIEETSEDPSTKRRRVAWHISSGEVNFQTVRQNMPDSSTEISTPTVRTTTGEPSEGSIIVAQSGDSDVRLYRGATEVQTRSGEKIHLGASEGLKVDAAGKPAPKVTLPPVPALLAPPHQTEVSYVNPAQATTLLVWKPVPGASSYHLMLDYSAYFNRPLVDRAGIKDSSVELRGLDTGKYYWKVAAVDTTGVAGPYSEFARFTVSRPQGIGTGSGPPPMLSLQQPLDVRANILQVKGRTEPGATLTVNGQRVDVASDGTFNEFVTLDKQGKQTVLIRSMGLNGGVRELRPTVVVSY